MPDKIELLCLPPELVARTIALYVKDVGIEQAWKNRHICRYIRDLIKEEVLAKPRMYAYGRSQVGRKILKNNLADFLFYRSRNSATCVRDVLPVFINDILNKVLEMTDPPVQPAHIDPTHRLIVCQLLVKNFDGAAWCINNDNKKVRGDTRSLRLTMSNQNVLAVAAVMGNLNVISKLIVRDSQITWKESFVFGPALEAATTAGQFDVIEYLIESAKLNAFLGKLDHHGFDRQSLSGPIGMAIELKHVRIARYLIRSQTKLFGFIDGATAKFWLCRAHSMELKELIPKILRTLHASSSPGMYDVFKWCCERAKKHVGILFRHGKLDPNQRIERDRYIPQEYPLLTAIRHDAIDVVRKLLVLGAHPNGPKYLPHAERPINAALKKKRFLIFALLLVKGADPRFINKGVFEECREAILGQYAIYFFLKRALVHSLGKPDLKKLWDDSSDDSGEEEEVEDTDSESTVTPEHKIGAREAAAIFIELAASQRGSG